LTQYSGRNVISFSLYGSNPLYCEGAVENVKLAKKFYPGWTCRFYTDSTVPEDCLASLRNEGSEIIRVEKNLGPVHGRFWRFLVAGDQGISRFLIRDADSRLNSRERAAVHDWIRSGRSFHLMRDSLSHRRRMLGGMWGGIGCKLSNIAELVDNWGRFDRRGRTDEFLSEVIYPIIRNDCLIHDTHRRFKDEKALDFPQHEAMEGTSFVGEIVTLDRRGMDVWRRIGELQDACLHLEGELLRYRTARRERKKNLPLVGWLARLWYHWVEKPSNRERRGSRLHF